MPSIETIKFIIKLIYKIITIIILSFGIYSFFKLSILKNPTYNTLLSIGISVVGFLMNILV
jgi:hypothetical protein